MTSKIKNALFFIIITAFIISACGETSAESPPPPTVAPTPAPTAPPTPTEVPKRSLTVCLGQEPSTLYIYGGASRAMWSVLEAIYDGPVDIRNFTAQPVILSKLPSVKDGDAATQSVDVMEGDLVVDASGELIALKAGAKVLPAGCKTTSCALEWDGKSPLQMERMGVLFRLLSGIRWADGQPLTAADSVYSYRVSADPATSVSRTLIDRTASYRSVDDNTVEWVGVPGFFPSRPELLFWHPLPYHALGNLTPQELPTAEAAARSPLGWGPYMIQEWVAGDHLTLVKNPGYYRAAEGLPRFDNLVFRFLGRPADSNLEALLSGECDVLDRTTGLDELVQQVRSQELKQALVMAVGQGPDWEQMVFGIRPAAYDAKSPAARPDYFGDLRVRQAFASCMDRPRIVKDILFEMSSIPNSYLPPTHPLYIKDLPVPPFDVEAGKRLLDEVGWRDADNNPATPRQSLGVANVPDGTPFVVDYLTTGATLRLEAVQILSESLAQCGIQINRKTLEPAEIYAPGPAGLVFGRNFDLVQLAWMTGLDAPCSLYTSQQIPTQANNWLGINVTGYSNPEYDAACLASRQTRADQSDEYLRWQVEAQRLFARDLPAVPLYFRLTVAAARPDFCGLTMDVSARSDLWNMETWDYGAGCKQ